MKVLIFGASSDIGIAICAKYLKSGWSVIAVSRLHRNELSELKNLFPEQLKLIEFEFINAEGLRHHLQDELNLYFSCDTVINCIGIAHPKKYEDILEHDVIEHIKINAIPNIVLSQFFSTFMLKRRWGRFVYISSIGIKFNGGLDSYCYSMSKLLIEFFPAIAKKYWAPNNVFVNVVRAGYIDTKFHSQFIDKSPADRISLIPARRAGQPSEVAEAVFFLGSELNTFTTCEVLTVAGGE